MIKLKLVHSKSCKTCKYFRFIENVEGCVPSSPYWCKKHKYEIYSNTFDHGLNGAGTISTVYCDDYKKGDVQMRFIINNFRAAKNVDLDLQNIALIAGKNFNGKSSIAQACAMLMTGQTAPDGVLKKDIKGIIRHGMKKSVLSVTSAKGSGTIKYPDATFAETGEAPASNPVAVGLQSPVEMNPKELSKYLTTLLSLEPTRADFDLAIEEAGFKPKDVDSFWERIVDKDWTDTHTEAKNRGAELKGEWRGVTGESYGRQKAEGWEPEGWLPEYANESINKLTNEIATLGQQYTAALQQEAVDENEIENLEALAATIKEKARAVNKADKVVESCTNAVKKIKEKPVYEPARNGSDGQPCPHCKKLVVVNADGTLGTETGRSLEDYEAAVEKYDKYMAELSPAEDAKTTAWEDYNFATADLSTAENAGKELKEMNTNKIVGDPDGCASAIDIAGEKERKEAIMSMLLAGDAADTIHQRIIKGEILIAAMAEDGCRKAALMRGLQNINGDLAAISRAAGWDLVRISEELQIFYGTTPYAACSIRLSETSPMGSNQYRVKAVFQMYIAKKTASSLLIFDGADILDKQGRNDLMRLIVGFGIPAIICMTLHSREETPDAKNKDIPGGASYWIENGELTAV